MNMPVNTIQNNLVTNSLKSTERGHNSFWILIPYLFEAEVSLRHANEGLLAHPLLVRRRLLPGEGVLADGAQSLQDDVRVSAAVDDIEQHVDEREAQETETQKDT